MRSRFATLLILLSLGLIACGQPAAPRGEPQQPASDGGAPPAQRGRTLVMGARSELPSLAGKPLQLVGISSATVTRLFNAGLALLDDRGNPHPYLAEQLPQLNTDTWRVFPDGRMETTYRLRSGLTWHDGRELTADDFVFSWQLYSVPELGHAGSPPIALLDDVTAADARTVVFRWKSLYADAGALEARGSTGAPTFPPLPRHVFEAGFRQGNWDAFVSHPGWSTDYVGLGPYRLERWESGSFVEAAAFAGHALGRPMIERIRVLFIPDFNTTVTNMLAGEVHVSVDDSIRFQQGMVLKREWAPRNTGSVLVYPALWRWIHVQQRPEYASPRSLLDARVRKALAHGIDKGALSDALFESEGIMTETPVPPIVEYFAQVDAAAAKYPYDPRRVEQLMGEVGYSKGGDGVYAHPALGRFTAEFGTFQSPQNESEMAIVTATWRQLGFDMKEIVYPAVQARDYQLRNIYASFIAASGPPGERTLVEHKSAEIPTPANRWNGSNRGGWSNPEFDRLADAFDATLDRAQRGQLVVQMARIFSEDAAVLSLYFNPSITAHVAALRGPTIVAPTIDVGWNVHEWQWAP
jgi:peptide/nickel transport system substrate-binding protein